MQRSRNRITQLEGLRIIAIAMIFLSHMEFIYTGPVTYPYSGFYLLHLHNPDIGVDYFFMLSGFGMYMASQKAERLSVSLKGSFAFTWRKIRRVYPFYLVSMALMLPFQLGLFHDGMIHAAELKTTLMRLPLSLTLTQTLLGVKSVSRQMNNVCWFLSSLTVVYFFSPFLLAFFRNRIRTPRQAVAAILVTFAVHLAVFVVFQLIERNGIFGIYSLNDLSYGSPYNRIFYVALGMEIGALCHFCSGRRGISTAGEFCAAFAVLLYYATKRLIPENTLPEALLVRVLDISAILILLGTFSLGRGKLSAALGRLSGASKYVIFIFLFHYPLRFYIDRIFTGLRLSFGDFTPVIEILVILGLSILVALACSRLQEGSLRKKTTGQSVAG